MCVAIAAVVAGFIVNGQASTSMLLQPLFLQSVEGFLRIVEPLVQLFVVLVLVEWFLKRIGVTSFSSGQLAGLEWNTQSLVALIVISSFAAAALAAASFAAACAWYAACKLAAMT